MSRALVLLVVLAACSNEASHVPNPVLLPGHAISAGLHNVAYNARRRPVSALVTQNHAELVTEISAGGGPVLDQAMALARVPVSRRPELQARLREDLDLYRRDPEALTVAIMVQGG